MGIDFTEYLEDDENSIAREVAQRIAKEHSLSPVGHNISYDADPLTPYEEFWGCKTCADVVSFSHQQAWADHQCLGNRWRRTPFDKLSDTEVEEVKKTRREVKLASLSHWVKRYTNTQGDI